MSTDIPSVAFYAYHNTLRVTNLLQNESEIYKLKNFLKINFLAVDFCFACAQLFEDIIKGIRNRTPF